MNFNNPYQSYSHQNIWDGIKDSFKEGNHLTKLIYINFGVFLVVKLIGVLIFLFNLETDQVPFLVHWLSVPAETSALLSRPWTVFSYMFLHEEFLHILVNMLWLFWFGKIFLSYLDQKKLLSIYLIGGLTGAAAYIFAYNIFPVFQNSEYFGSYALGASASVMAVVLATVIYAPNHIVRLMFIGSVKIKHIAIFFVATDVLSIADGNAGGHIAHLGGAFYGWLFISNLRKGKDISAGFNSLADSFLGLFKRRKMKVSHKNAQGMDDKEYNKSKIVNQEQLDKILEKIAKSGYDSLSKEEKEILFKSSNQK